MIRHVDEFLKLMQVMTGDDRYEKAGKVFSEEDRKAGITMCYLFDRAEARGMERGLSRGLEALVASLKNYISEPEVLYQAIVKNEAYQNVTKEEVLKYL
ncbi:MAG: hypothetical protein IJY09_08745 [Lachnospiraceae bacterium]|nr:hypothetical protein [Lachnospiraceae bacterium]